MIIDKFFFLFLVKRKKQHEDWKTEKKNESKLTKSLEDGKLDEL